MTLAQVISRIEGVAMNQPSVNTIIGSDVFRLNETGDARYGVFAWTQGLHRLDTATGMMRYAFTLFYVDRLTSKRDNETEVQSVGIQTLQNILLNLEDEMDVESVDFTSFNQRFTDECAGVFASVVFLTDATIVCGETFGRDEDEYYEYLLTAEGWQVIDALGAKIMVRKSTD